MVPASTTPLPETICEAQIGPPVDDPPPVEAEDAGQDDEEGVNNCKSNNEHSLCSFLLHLNVPGVLAVISALKKRLILELVLIYHLVLGSVHLLVAELLVLSAGAHLILVEGIIHLLCRAELALITRIPALSIPVKLLDHLLHLGLVPNLVDCEDYHEENCQICDKIDYEHALEGLCDLAPRIKIILLRPLHNVVEGEQHHGQHGELYEHEPLLLQNPRNDICRRAQQPHKRQEEQGADAAFQGEAEAAVGWGGVAVVDRWVVKMIHIAIFILFKKLILNKNQKKY